MRVYYIRRIVYNSYSGLSHFIYFVIELYQGRSDVGGYRDLYPPKSAKVNFLWGKNDVRTGIQQFYPPPKTFIPPKQISGYAPELYLNTTYIQVPTIHAHIHQQL